MTTNTSKTDAPAEAVSQIKPIRVQVAPRSQAAAITYARLGLPGSGVGKRPMNVAVAPRSSAGEAGHARAQPAAAAAAPQVEAIAPGLHPTPAHDLVFQGGKTLRNLVFTNLYVGGQASWNATDVQSIDDALSAAMSDQRLNNVMMQYFNNQSITSTFRPSQILPGAKPAVVSQGDVEAMVSDLYTRGLLDAFDLGSTVFNFMLPSSTILNTDAARTAQAAKVHQAADAGAGAGAGAGAAPQAIVPEAEQEADSLNGLGGYHGSIHVSKQHGAQVTLYYAVGVFSEVLANGRANGIPVFNKPWKNVVATFYHELNEARTDADVEDAIRAGNDPAGTRFLGWVSQDGEECGDFPISEANPLTQVMKEVRLTNSTKKVPVQFQYSNAVHGPEGPIAHPH